MKRRTLLCMVLMLLFAIGLASRASALEPSAAKTIALESGSLAGEGLTPNDTVVVDESKQGSTENLGAQQAGAYSITVVNKQKCCVDLYLDDNFLGSLPKRSTRLTVEGVPAGKHTLFAKECDEPEHWGPKTINLKKNFVWKLWD